MFSVLDYLLALVSATTRPYFLFVSDDQVPGNFSVLGGIDLPCETTAIARGYDGGSVYFYGLDILTRLTTIRSSVPILSATNGQLIAHNLIELRLGSLPNALSNLIGCNGDMWSGLNSVGLEDDYYSCLGFSSINPEEEADLACCNCTRSGWESYLRGQCSSKLAQVLCLWDPPLLSPTSTPATTSPTSSPSSATPGTNVPLAVGLSVGLVVFFALVLAAFFWWAAKKGKSGFWGV